MRMWSAASRVGWRDKPAMAEERDTDVGFAGGVTGAGWVVFRWV